jgi:hypothetical protein
MGNHMTSMDGSFGPQMAKVCGGDVVAIRISSRSWTEKAGNIVLDG